MNVYIKAGDRREEIRSIRGGLVVSERRTGGIETLRVARGPAETAVGVDAQSIWMFDALRGAGWEEIPEEGWNSERRQSAEEIPTS